MNRRRTIVLAGLVWLASTTAAASTIEYQLETALDSAYGSLASGTPITILFRYDDVEPDLLPGDPNLGAYDLLMISVSAVGETAFFTDPIAGTGSLNILNATTPTEDDRLGLAAISGVTLATTSGSLGGVPLSNLQIDLLDTTDSIFSNGAIPGTALGARDFSLLAGLLDDGRAIDQSSFTSLTSLTGQVVPEPSAALLLPLGLAALAARRCPKLNADGHSASNHSIAHYDRNS